MKKSLAWVRWAALLIVVAGLIFVLSHSFWKSADRAVMDFLGKIGVAEQAQVSPQVGHTELITGAGTTSAIPAEGYGIIRIILTLVLTTLLGAIVALRGDENRLERSSILEAHMILAVAAALMMMIIGSQIARAFGLMGAASIVRYRYSLRSPKEGSSLIIALGVGMACGTGLYVLAAATALFVQLIFRLPRILPGWLRGSWGGEMNHYELSITSTDMKTTIDRLQKKVAELKGSTHISKVREKEGKFRINARVTLPSSINEDQLTQGLIGSEITTFEWESLKGKKE